MGQLNEYYANHGAYKSLYDMKRDYGITVDRGIYSMEANAAAAGSYAAAAGFNATGVCVGAFVSKNGNKIAVFLYGIDGQELHPVQVSN